MVIEAKLSPKAKNALHVDIVERHGRPNDAGDARLATFHGNVARWRLFRAILADGAQANGVPFVVTGREDRVPAFPSIRTRGPHA